MPTEPTDDLESGLRSTFTPEAWEEVVGGVVVPVYEPAGYGKPIVCSICGSYVPDEDRHTAWHRRLSVAIRAQGVMMAAILAGLQALTESETAPSPDA